MEHWRGTPTLSPGGKYLLYFDENEADWFTYRIADGVQDEPDRQTEHQLLAGGSRLAEHARRIRERRVHRKRRLGAPVRQVRHLGDQAGRHGRPDGDQRRSGGRNRSYSATARSIPISAQSRRTSRCC